MQTIFRISDGSGVKLTTSKYYTPSGADITKNGIAPEIKIINDITDEPTGLTNKKKTLGTPLKLKASSLKAFFEKQGVVLNKTRDATVEFARRILKNSNIANKKKSLEKAREIAANINY